MADQFIQVPGDSTGKKVDVSELVVGANTVERERIVLASDSAATALAPVTSSAGLLTNVSSGLISISGVPTILSASSGIIQTAATVTTSTPELGAGVALITQTTAGALRGVISSGLISVTSGTITLSSVHTVTATAGTNPWSSAPS